MQQAAIGPLRPATTCSSLLGFGRRLNFRSKRKKKYVYITETPTARYYARLSQPIQADGVKKIIQTIFILFFPPFQ